MTFEELRLTSPHMTGPNVRHAQESLNHNRFGDFYDGKIDGDFGPLTAGAVKEAKFKLGYPKRMIDQHYDERLDNHLNNQHDISPLMKKRRQSRIKQAKASGDIKLKALQLALNQVGIKESPPNSNRCKFSEWYGIIGPWCLMFVAWCEVNAGSKIFAKGSRWAYNPFLASAVAHGDFGMRFTSSPEKGDLVQYNWSNGSVPEHIEIFIEWKNSAHTEFETVGGNTSSSSTGSQSNGGMVARRTRFTSEVTHFIRLPS